MKPADISSSFSNARTLPPPTRAQINALAHAIWMDRGCPEGCALDHWFEAERQLRGEIRVPAADDPRTDVALDYDRAEAGRVNRALQRIGPPLAPRSPTSL